MLNSLKYLKLIVKMDVEPHRIVSFSFNIHSQLIAEMTNDYLTSICQTYTNIFQLPILECNFLLLKLPLCTVRSNLKGFSIQERQTGRNLTETKMIRLKFSFAPEIKGRETFLKLLHDASKFWDDFKWQRSDLAQR